jgi:hypothetical protein
MPILGANSSGGSRPSAPVIGSATDGGTGTTASVAFTPSTYIGKGTITYTATSSPGSITATGSSPITVTGLTTGTAYTFTVQGATNYGVTSAASSASNSVTPAAPTSFESVATATGTGSSGTITFSSIPSTYKTLEIRYTAKSTTNANDYYQLRLQFNGSTSGYAHHGISADGNNVTATGVTGLSYLQTSFGNIPGSGANLTNIPGSGIIKITDYASTAKNKTLTMLAGFDLNRVGGLPGYMHLYSGLWANTSAVDSLTITLPTGSFTTGSTFALYGVK